MDNMRASVEGNELVLRINLQGDLGPSKTKATIHVAGTNGMERTHQLKGFMFMCNVYKKHDATVPTGAKAPGPVTVTHPAQQEG